MTDWSRGMGVLTVCLAVSGCVGWAVGQGGQFVLGLPLPLACAVLAMAINLVAWIPASIARTEHFFDLTGSATFLAVLTFSLASVDGPVGTRGWCVAAAVAIWALRLGTFLYRRIAKDGKDGRFDALKTRPERFLIPWSLQGLWVFLTGLGCTTLLSAKTGSTALLWTDLAGGGLWLVGFGLEVVADAQKRAFRAQPDHRGRFIQSGLWAWSRHPNYLGEILLWTGIALIGSGVYTGGQWLAWLSPIFVTLLLTKVSGIPMLEARADSRWGSDPEYQAYKDRTPVLLLRRPQAH